jgi:hypothetical protein
MSRQLVLGPVARMLFESQRAHKYSGQFAVVSGQLNKKPAGGQVFAHLTFRLLHGHLDDDLRSFARRRLHLHPAAHLCGALRYDAKAEYIRRS